MKISIGFEAQTQHISVNRVQSRQILDNDEFWSQSLTKFVNIYPDVLTTDYYLAQQKITPFLRQINKENFDQLKINELTISKDKIKSLFNDAEFVVTFANSKNITTDLFEYMIEKFKSCIKLIKSMISKFNEIEEINISSDTIQLFNRRIKFPYKYITSSKKFKNLKLFFIENPNSIGDCRFVFQCTLGIPILESMNIMIYLMDIAVKNKVRSKKDNFDNIVEMVNIIMERGDFKTDRQDFLKNYLFLFFYSYLTKNIRKSKAEFVIRHSFTREMSCNLTLAEKRKIESLLDPKDLLDYFHYTHFTSQQNIVKLYQFQNIRDVGLPHIFDGETVLIEFRLFNSILLHMFEKENITLNIFS